MSTEPSLQDKRLLKKSLRKTFRSRRQNLSTDTQVAASNHISKKLTALLSIENQPTLNLAVYLANDGEPNLTSFIQTCWEHNHHCLVPILHPFTSGCAIFQRYETNTEMKHNKYGIWEPRLNCKQLVTVDKIDAIILPLVAFDDNKNRLGMGGGYYDKTLASTVKSGRKPKLIGVAHNEQRSDSPLPTEPWDITLDNIVTPNLVI